MRLNLMALRVERGEWTRDAERPTGIPTRSVNAIKLSLPKKP